jgi:hypothetical protein
MSGGPVARSLRAVSRVLHQLVHPQHAEEQAQLDRIAKSIATSASAERDQLDLMRRQIEGLSERVALLALDRDLRGVHKQIDQMRDAQTRQHRMLSQGLRFAQWEESLRVDERRIERRLRRLAKTGQPVLVGPWSGEVGFELLYWIPFVTWVLKKAAVSPDRITVVSRGGPSSWYSHLGGRYLDVLSLVPPDEFRARTELHKKQRTLGAFDREIVRRMIAVAGLERPFLLHPGLMYRLFIPYWKQTATVRRVEDYTHYEPVRCPSVRELAGRLPPNYVAVRFYFSSCFPDTPTNRAFVETTVRALTETTSVVMLNTSFDVDDHRDCTPERSSRILMIDDLMTPERNLDVQTAVIAGARAFVGTYGGYSYLAPLCGVPSLAFYSVREAFFAHHLELAERVFREMKAGSLVPLDVRDTNLVRMALGSPSMLRS